MTKGFLTDMAKYLPAQIVPGMVGLVSIPIVTRLFPPADYGHYSIVMATVMVLSTVFGWLPVSVIRYYPAYERQDRLAVFSTTIVTLGAAAIALLTILYYATLLVLKAWMSMKLWTLLMIGGLLFMMTCTFNLFQAILRSKRFAGHYSAFAVWQSVAGFGLGMVFVLLLGLDIEGLLLGMILGFVPILPLLHRGAVNRDTHVRLGGIDPQAAKATFMYGLPLMVGNLAAWVLALSDRYTLGILRNSSEVGVYSLSYNIADKSLMLLTTLFTITEAAIGMHIWENRGEQASKQFISSVTRFYLLLCIPAGVGLSVLSRPIVSILAGAEYVNGYRIMPFILAGSFLLGLQQRFHWGFLFHQKTAAITLALVIAGLLKVLLNILFVPAYGYFGAAVTTTVCYAALLLLIVAFSRRLFVWKFPFRSLLNIAVASTVMGIVVYSVGHVAGLAPTVRLVVAVFIGVAVYVSVLLALGEFSLEELRVVRQALAKALAAAQSIAGTADNR
jgi:O-antigen/teichoic acid export membrane protein